MKYRMQEDSKGWALSRINDHGDEEDLGSYGDFESCLAACREAQGLSPHGVEEPLEAPDPPPEPEEATSGPETEPEEPSSDDPPEAA